MARSYGMRVFEAKNVEELTTEEYQALVQVELDAMQKDKTDQKTPNTVSVVTKP